jgi:hypothetical protein
MHGSHRSATPRSIETLSSLVLLALSLTTPAYGQGNNVGSPAILDAVRDLQGSVASNTQQLAQILQALSTIRADVQSLDNGVVLIDQPAAVAGNVTPGDAAGFPVTLSHPGSYRLAGNLVVPDANTTAIVITSDDVTLDLNGFSIRGPVDCSAGFPCANIGAQQGYGVLAGTDGPSKGYYRITIRNGTIHGMGADAVHVLGDSVRVEDLHVSDNGFSGIVVRSPGVVANAETNFIVRRNNVQRNGGYGIKTYAGAITDNVITESRTVGISVQVGAGLVARNLVSGSGEWGLGLTPTVSYFGNTLVNNVTPVVGGVNVGQNLCNTATCP